MKNNILKKEYIEAFIGKRELKWYEKAFEKYENNELKFNLIACIFSYLYLIYRKCYKAGIIIGIIIFFSSTFLGEIGNIISLVVSVLCGLYGPKFVFIRYKENLKKFENLSENRIIANLKLVGGFDIKWVIGAVLFTGIFNKILMFVSHGGYEQFK